MITKQEIIYKLYPNIRTLRGQQSGQEATSWDAFDIDGNPVSFDMTPVDAEYDSQEYARNRKKEYNQLNQFEMQFDDDRDSTTTWVDKINEIKGRHPK